MIWLFLTIIAYVLNGVAVLTDKFLLKKSIPHPLAYAFYASMLGALVFLLFPFAPGTPPLPLLLIAIGAGGLFTGALLLFYSLLRQGEASRISALVGGLTPLWIALLAFILLDERLTGRSVAAFCIILAGSYLISRNSASSERGLHAALLLQGLLTAFLFAASFVLSKLVYTEYSFVGGLIWRTAGSVLSALALLVFHRDRREVAGSFKQKGASTGALFLAGQAAAAASFILVNYAFTLGPIALVQALSGVQYIFVFCAALLFGTAYPHIFAEELSPRATFMKALSILLIATGIAFLFLF